MAHCEIKSGKESVKVNSLKNHEMCCTVCDKKLGTLVESDKKSKMFNRTTKFSGICYCGGESFTIKSEQQCYFVPEDDVVIKSMEVDTENRDFIENKIILGKA